jgi:hypothetical protein
MRNLSDRRNRWGIVLAGGDGVRLRPGESRNRGSDSVEPPVNRSQEPDRNGRCASVRPLLFRRECDCRSCGKRFRGVETRINVVSLNIQKKL